MNEYPDQVLPVRVLYHIPLSTPCTITAVEVPKVTAAGLEFARTPPALTQAASHAPPQGLDFEYSCASNPLTTKWRVFEASTASAGGTEAGTGAGGEGCPCSLEVKGCVHK